MPILRSQKFSPIFSFRSFIFYLFIYDPFWANKMWINFGYLHWQHYVQFPSTIVEKTMLPSLNCLHIFSKNQFIIMLWVCFWTYFIPFIYISILSPLTYYPESCSFILILNWVVWVFSFYSSFSKLFVFFYFLCFCICILDSDCQSLSTKRKKPPRNLICIELNM